MRLQKFLTITFKILQNRRNLDKSGHTGHGIIVLQHRSQDAVVACLLARFKQINALLAPSFFSNG